MKNNKILLCASDAGGIKNIASLISRLQDKKYLPILVTNIDHLGIFSKLGVEILSSEHINSEYAVEELIKKIQPIAIMCGTSRYICADRFMIAAANRLCIKSFVVLDEWYGYAIRFTNEKGELAYLPSVICCQDEQAKMEAKAEGIPAQILKVTGNPALSYLTKMAKQFFQKKPDVLSFLKPYQKFFFVTFLSETYAVDFGEAQGEVGRFGSHLGYTEKTVCEDIISVLENSEHKIVLIEKLHPETVGKDFIKSNHRNIVRFTVKHIDLWRLLLLSDLVIGMRSMALLESCILGRPTVSYQPGRIGDQRCSAVRLGLISCLSTRSDLEKWCKNESEKINRKRNEVRPLKVYPFAREDSIDNVIRCITDN